ncbi:MAG: co-chaperone GroES [Chloroflexota bacterium]
MSVNLQPLGSNLVIEPTEEEERTAVGIILPETAKQKPQRGIVLAIGPGRRLDSGEREAMDLEVGDKVLYPKYGGTEIKVGDKNLLIIGADSILAKFLD